MDLTRKRLEREYRARVPQTHSLDDDTLYKHKYNKEDYSAHWTPNEATIVGGLAGGILGGLLPPRIFTTRYLK